MADARSLPLEDLHAELGAKFVPFAGWSMPVQYKAGVMAEHLWCREKAGLFDVSHMGQVLMPLAADVALEGLVPADILGLPTGRQRYGLFTNAAGGILDDLMIARRPDDLFLVVNAARADHDIAHLQAHIDGVRPLSDRALLALQGPMAEAAVVGVLPFAADMRFMDVRIADWNGAEIWISRSGYTGEDGFEISVPAAAADGFARALLADERVAPIGLGARDSLRLEAGLPLYGQDLSEEVSPIEAGLTWSIGKARRVGGDRAGGFPGADVILGQMADEAPRKRVGLVPETRAPMRAGVALYADDTSDAPIGMVTSGGFGPSLGGPMAMALVDAGLDTTAPIFGDVRGKRLPARITKLPFHTPGYKR